MADTSSTTPATRTRTRRKTAATATGRPPAKKAAATRARNGDRRAQALDRPAKKAAATRRDLERTPVERYVDYAGRVARSRSAPRSPRATGRSSAVEASAPGGGSASSWPPRVSTRALPFERRGETARSASSATCAASAATRVRRAGLVGARSRTRADRRSPPARRSPRS